MKNKELINIGAQAPAPSKDYCQLILDHDYIILRRWKVTLRGDSDNRFPSEIKDTYEDFAHDENIQRGIYSVFGKDMYDYIANIIERKKLDLLDRLPDRILAKIVAKLALEDISKLSQVNSHFRQICKSDKVWIKLYKQYYSKEITPELRQLAESSENGWRKLFFTNKLKLQLELRRQAKKSANDDQAYTSRTSRSINDESRSRTRNSKSVSGYNDDDDLIINSSMKSKLRYSTFLTEDY
ncbi:unnamed protein product [Brachionus calyciflorus]|uniref:F-box domain-containing protein n=1 Tax=Brachionus calyciflorus TaxID=104777 RepID=A0A814LZK5_9BILA|nr:unnamed protein product [Brachionus calyciflorus]